MNPYIGRKKLPFQGSAFGFGKASMSILIALNFLAVASRASHPVYQNARAGMKLVAAKPAAARASKLPKVSQSSFAKLAQLQIRNANTRQTLSVRLYDPSGQIDERAARRLDTLLCDSRDREHELTTTLDRRLLQLVFRAAYHFSSEQVEVISAYRQAGRKREGLHALGRAIDFKLSGVKSPILAAYLRTIPRVGVGIYTHPKTQFVHLDVRDQSFHWLDASPPGRHWREQNIGSKALILLDAKYLRSNDWPEGLIAPVQAR